MPLPPTTSPEINATAEATGHDRAAQSLGISHSRIYEAIVRELRAAGVLSGASVVDVGCGRAHVLSRLRDAGFTGPYAGVDLLRHADFPADLPLTLHDLSQPGIPLPDGSADLVVSSEVLPHLENPRVLVRECARLARPGGGTVVLTAPNGRSLRSLILLVRRGHPANFGPTDYPMMLNPVLPMDLQRMFRECGLLDPRVFHTGWGRALPPLRGDFPRWLARWFPVACSDHYGVIARRP